MKALISRIATVKKFLYSVNPFVSYRGNTENKTTTVTRLFPTFRNSKPIYTGQVSNESRDEKPATWGEISKMPEYPALHTFRA